MTIRDEAAYAVAAPPVVSVAPRLSRISWGAIIAGLLVALGIHILLHLLGAGIGLGMVTPSLSDASDVKEFGLGAGIWGGVTMLISLLIGSYVAARLSGTGNCWDGVLHGVVIWAAGVLVMIWLLAGIIGAVVGVGLTAAGGAAAAIGETVKQAAPQALEEVKGSGDDAMNAVVDNLMNDSNRDPMMMNRDQARGEVLRLLPGIFEGGADADQAKDRVAAIIASQTGISPEDARKRVDQAQADAQKAAADAEAKAKQIADDTAKATSISAYVGFAALLLGLLASAAGGAIGRRRADPYVIAR